MMLFQVYKPRQGMRARVAALAAGAVMAVFLAQWLHAELIEKSPGWSYGVPIAVAAIVMIGVLWLANWPRLVDLLVETESELNKVAWSSRRDLWKSTWVVILTIFIMGVFMFAVARIVEQLFKRTNVLLPDREQRTARAAADWPWAARGLPAGKARRTGDGRVEDA